MRYELEGNGRSLTVDDNGVHITKTMKMGRGYDKTIPFAQLASIEYSPPGMMSAGYLYFQTIGSSGTKIKDKMAMSLDENAVFFMKKYNDLALNIKSAVEDAIIAASSNGKTSPVHSDADELLKLKNLLDAGVLTQEEFDKKKAQILGF